MSRDSELRHDDEAEARGIERRVEQLRESHRQLRREHELLAWRQQLMHALIEHIPDQIYLKDSRGRFVHVNRAWAHQWGLSGPDEATGKTDRDFLSPDFAAQALEVEKEILRTGTPIVGRVEKLVTSDGRVKWFSSTRIPVTDDTGKIVGTCGLSREITELLKTEEELEKERNLLRTVVDNIPDFIFVKDSQSRFVLSNRAHMEILGIQSRDQLLGKTDYDFFPRDLVARYLSDEQVVLQMGKAILNREEPVRDKEGRQRWLSTTKVAARDSEGRIVGLVGISRDITAHKEFEDELEKERNLLRTLIDNMPDYIFIKDTDSRFVINNKAHLKVLGKEKQEEVSGKSDFDFFSRELAARYFSDEQLVIQSGRPVVNRQEPARDPDGRRIWLSTTKVATRDSGGKIVGLVGISRDVTERKEFEEALQKAKDELELRVQERTADLKEANDRLQERLSQLRFLNTTSHELAQFIRVEELTPAIVDAFRVRFPDAEVSICLRDAEGFTCQSATQMLRDDRGWKSSEEALGVFARRELQRPFFVPDWRNDDHVGGLPWRELHLPSCYMAIPLLADNRALAIVQIFTTEASPDFHDREQPVLTTLSAHAATCLSNAIHYRELGQRARIQAELDAARSIQQRFTPREKPHIPHVNVKGVYYPAFEVGGDYLDYFPIENGNWVIVIADVCGKGIPAALFMTMLRSAFRVAAQGAVSAREILCRVNESMSANLDDKSFVTALCLVIDPSGSSMSYSRAGHPMMVRIDEESGQPRNIESSGLALGLVSDTEHFASMIDEVTLQLTGGSRFLIYTDGLTEATDPARNSYGHERLFNLLEVNRRADPDTLVELIMKDIKGFARGSPYHDDLTMLAIEVNGDGH